MATRSISFRIFPNLTTRTNITRKFSGQNSSAFIFKREFQLIVSTFTTLKKKKQRLKMNCTSYDALLNGFVFLCSRHDCKARMFVGCELYNCYSILMHPLDFQCDFDLCFQLLWFRLVVMGSNDFMCDTTLSWSII